MSSTKRVSGDYTIHADTVSIFGNLSVVGTSTSIETTNSNIQDNIITLNDGEVGAGISLGTAGIQIDRGSSPDVVLRYNESGTRWEFTNDGSTYFGIAAIGVVSAAGSDTQIQYNASGSLGAESNFRYDYTTNTLYLGNLQISGNTITTHSTNGNLVLDTNGTGRIVFLNYSSLETQVSDPSSSVGYNHFYAKTPGTGSTGLYFVNTTTSGEVASANKALLLSLIL